MKTGILETGGPEKVEVKAEHEKEQKVTQTGESVLEPLELDKGQEGTQMKRHNPSVSPHQFVCF